MMCFAALGFFFFFITCCLIPCVKPLRERTGLMVGTAIGLLVNGFWNLALWGSDGIGQSITSDSLDIILAIIFGILFIAGALWLGLLAYYNIRQIQEYKPSAQVTTTVVQQVVPSPNPTQPYPMQPYPMQPNPTTSNSTFFTTIIRSSIFSSSNSAY